jgi:hypothetical protein
MEYSKQRKKRKMYRGPSGFAIMSNRFPRKRFLSQYPKSIEKPFLPVLYKYFGVSWRGITLWLERFWELDKLLEMHLCFRRLDPHIARYAADIVKKLNDINPPNTRLLLCPCLEDNVPDKDWRMAAKKVRLAAPGISLVRCPLALMYKGGRYEERHTKRPYFTNKPPRRQIVNPDGCTIDFGDNENYLYDTPNRRNHILSFSGAKRFIQSFYEEGVYAIAPWSAYQVPVHRP